MGFDLAAEASGAAGLRVLAPGNSGGTALDEVVTPAHSPITTVDQLRGKTIAVNALKGLAVLLTSNVLVSHGVPASAVHFVADPFPAMAQALAAHRVDAAFMTEPFLSAAVVGQGMQPLFDIDQGAATNFPIAGHIVTQSWTAKYPGTAAAFTRALMMGQQVAGDQPGRRRAGAPERLAHQQADGRGHGPGLLPADHDRRRPGAGRRADARQRASPVPGKHGSAREGDDPMTAGLPLTSSDAMKARVAEGFAAAAAAYDADGTEFFGPMGERLVAHASIKPGGSSWTWAAARAR